MRRVGIIKFPGTNCDLDVKRVVEKIAGLEARIVWFKRFKQEEFDAIVIPGGFSYGDWLRAGAIAARSPAMREVERAAEDGKPVLGICNGFQILVEACLLPGALLSNDPPRFICKWVRVKVENVKTAFTREYQEGEVVSMPIAHAEGRFYAEGPINVVFRYHGENPNGSLNAIAGVSNDRGNVVGLMPHPERSAEPEITPRGFDSGGYRLWISLRESLAKGW